MMGNAGRKIRCVETGEIFGTAEQLAKVLGYNAQSIRRLCLAGNEARDGRHYEYMDVRENDGLFGDCAYDCFTCPHPDCIYVRTLPRDSEIEKFANELLFPLKGPSSTKRRCRLKIQCVETGEVYESAVEAAKAIGYGSAGAVTTMCRRSGKALNGLHYKILEDKNGR